MPVLRAHAPATRRAVPPAGTRAVAAAGLVTLLGAVAASAAPVGPAGVAPTAAPAAYGYARAAAPRAWAFPRDHGAHPTFATEWWYFTGILRDEQQRAFGYQLTFFRTALRPDLPPAASPWRTRDLVLGHLAVTDVQQGRFTMAEEIQRAAAGLAGTDTTAMHVWANSWSATADSTGFRLEATTDDLGVHLRLTAEKGVVLHGDGGLSRKTRDGYDASYYYSMPRLRSVGSVRVGGASYRVGGTTWMDHEFFTGDTPREGLGWDWFGARLDDGRDLMLYVVRAPTRVGATPGPQAQGTVVAADGSSRPLDTGGMEATPVESWTSPASGITYPVRWRIALPREGLRLEVTALVPQQEIRASRTVGFSYWEGACRFRVDVGNAATAGEGYVELTGYGPRSGRVEDGPRAP